VHSHPHEQSTMVERGCVRFTVDGADRLVSPGDVLRLPSGVPHGATMLDEEVVLIDIFSPIREDFLPSAACDALSSGSVRSGSLCLCVSVVKSRESIAA
jgi:quercetin dioxygenase-like cupin family protein